MSKPIIRVENVSYQYGGQEEAGTVAVQDVSLEVKQGELLAIIGHNGSGKSTLAKLLNALYIPTSGKVLVNDIDTADPKHVWDVRQNVGMVFQNPDNQIIASIVEEDVAFGLENMGVPQKEMRQRVDNALKAVGMAEFAGAAPHNLSGGQKQRVAIASVLAMKPDVMVLDESTAMLDPKGREEVVNTVWRLNKEEHITVVWITHFMEEACKADRVLVMEKGQIAMEGCPREVFSQVKHMKEIGLDVPRMAELADMLRKEGLEVRGDIMDIPEMVEELCRFKH